MNYQTVLENELEKIKGKTPTLLLHACCAPCSSYVLEYLSKYFKITVLYYNPNLDTEEEFQHRVEEEKRLLKEMPFVHPVSIIVCDYHPMEFEEKIQGLEMEEEGGSRCFICYRLRLEKTAQIALQKHFDYFTTTLSVSPYKNAKVLNEIGALLEKKYHVPYLYSDFKKKEGYKRSIVLSKQYSLYRQDYCGCKYSKQKQEERKRNQEKLCEIVGKSLV